ncbi:hypothetical protein L228DRAFT_244897 [Xylona heveae TC161]|uniref:Uncharacterized protein n=1 Tax=Xylona heveae (strain CBS 132557 / TC161) TaxID=1328760 RepID=A0A165HWS8_XYLHT|nr:hypothetical protein L228DRAFT_244897 [Xylona heveae TC161]KZF24033.1 hypothetical protein L228DRAFT_244897 [Xylona heveae TC161]
MQFSLRLFLIFSAAGLAVANLWTNEYASDSKCIVDGVKDGECGPSSSTTELQPAVSRVAEVGGNDYDIIGPEMEAIVADVLGLNDEEFATKWAHRRRGPTPPQFP